jgi:hypothetical protein
MRHGLAVDLGGVLDAAVGVVDQTRRGMLALDGYVEGVQSELSVQGLAHAPADVLGVCMSRMAARYSNLRW